MTKLTQEQVEREFEVFFEQAYEDSFNGPSIWDEQDCYTQSGIKEIQARVELANKEGE